MGGTSQNFSYFVLLSTSPRHIVLNDHLSAAPQKGPFWGGMFFEINSSIFVRLAYKKFGEDLGAEPTFRPHIGRFRPQIKIWNFKNMRFLLFLSKFGTFFLKCPNVEQNTLKGKIILFFSFRTSQRWNLVLVNIFLAV